MKTQIKRGLAAATIMTLGAAFAIGSASAAHATETWTISGLTLDNPVVIDGMSTSGDDGGFLAVTKQFLLRDGDTSVYSYKLADMAGVAETDASNDDSLVSDLKSNVSYAIAVTDDGSGGYEVASLTKLDNDGNVTTTVITLSQAINISSGSWLVVSGFGYLGLWNGSDGTTANGGNFYYIALDGAVTEYNLASGFDAFDPYPADHQEGSRFMGAGVGEFDGTDFWFVGTDSNGSISEFNITGTVETNELLDNVDAQSDSDTFMVSVCSKRLYIHTENNDGMEDWTSFFGQDITGNAEPMISADATFSSDGICTEETPELPNTGVDASAGVALAGVLAALGAVTFVVARRRQVASK